ncbi:hypothetical protein ABES33_14030 [Bacillus pseudomycoides]|uniref:hypothetical protein n=1 Tax=Bacillus pseudomycoides TaxID=64104 RepID=UPI003D19EE20
MKKLFAAFFVLALSFMSISSTPAMAANSQAELCITEDHSLCHNLYGKKPLYNSPSDPNIVGYVANQTVKIQQAWFLVNTSLGAKWMGFNQADRHLIFNFYAEGGTLYVPEKVPIRDNPGSYPVGYVAYQTVTVNQAWYVISTSLGDKWIGYNM